MNSTTFNNILPLTRLWRGLIAVALLCTVFSASAQWSYHTYEGTLAFKPAMVKSCPSLYKGDKTTIGITLQWGDAFPRPNAKWTIWQGEFQTTTSSGVTVTGLGRLVGSIGGGTLYITDLIIGDGEDACYFGNLDLRVKLQ